MNYFAAEPLIVDLLKKVLPSDLHERIFCFSDVQASFDCNVFPRISVIYNSDLAVKSNSELVDVEQLWIIVVSIQNSSQSNVSLPIRVDAGRLIGSIVSGLAGKQIGGSFYPLKFVKSPYRVTHTNGVSYFPIAFSVSFRFTSSSQ